MATLRGLREAADMTQEQLATKVGVKPARIADWERGAEQPETREIGLLALALGVTPPRLQEALARRDPAGGDGGE